MATQALSNINETVALLSPYLIALYPDERQSLPKMSDGTAPFVEKCLDYCQSNAQFAPPYLDVADFKSDMGMWKQLTAVLRPLQQLMQDLDDTTTEAGSESYTAALTFYKSVQQAAKLSIPGSKAIYEDLKDRFANNGPKSNGE